MSEIEDTYKQHFADTHDRENTIRQAVLHVDDFGQFRAGRPVTLALLQDYRARVAKDSHANTYKNLRLTYVKQFLQWARRRGVVDLDGDDMRATLKGFAPERRLPKILSSADLRRLVETIGGTGGEMGRFALVGLLTGMRRAEIENLSASHVDDVQITVWAPKTRAERIIPLSVLGTGAQLFKAKRLSFRFNKRQWAKLRTAAGLRGVPFKTLRATWSSYAKSSGMDTWTVEQILGHTPRTAARHYDRLVANVEGKTAPEWYGLEKEIGRLCNG